MENKKEIKQLEKEKIEMLIKRDFLGNDELLKQESFNEYLKALLTAVEANITKPKEYQCNNKVQENGLCEWEDENNACSSREITYWRVENMLHIINYAGLTALCELNKQRGQLLPVFLYCLNNLEEIDRVYDGQIEHLRVINTDSLVKTILYTKIYNSTKQEIDKSKIINRIIFYNVIHKLTGELATFDDLDVDVKIYDIDDKLRDLLEELTVEFEKGATEDELIKKAINSQSMKKLVDIKEIKKFVKKNLIND